MKKGQIAIAICVIAFAYVQNASAQVFPTIDCHANTFDSKETPPTPDKNKRHPGEWMKWKIISDPGGWVVIEFRPKSGIRGDSPFNNPTTIITFDQETRVEIVKKGPVRADAAGANGEKYNYRITCYKPDGSSNTPIDPIIEVPKRLPLDEQKGN